jgi:hypothetical protein
MCIKLLVEGDFAPYNVLPPSIDTFIASWLFALLSAYYRSGGLEGFVAPRTLKQSVTTVDCRSPYRVTYRNNCTFQPNQYRYSYTYNAVRRGIAIQ